MPGSKLNNHFPDIKLSGAPCFRQIETEKVLIKN